MAQPLTKTKVGGELYVRPKRVEDQINEVVCLSLSELRLRLLVVDRNAPSYLCSECLVHLVRQGRRSENQQLMSAVLPVLLRRCEANLLVKIPDGGTLDATNLRQEILDNLSDLIVKDGTSDFPNELDFYECRFNKAFRTLSINAIRRDERRRKRDIIAVDLPPFEAKSETGAYDNLFDKVLDTFKNPATQEWHVINEQLWKAIKDLPINESKAIIFVNILQYKVESDNSEEVTAATLCNCTGRTIRNRLARAAAKLSPLMEDL